MYLDSGEVATERGAVGGCDFDCGFGIGIVADSLLLLLLLVLGVNDSCENSRGLFGWEEEPKRDRAQLEVSPSIGLGGDAVVDREVLEEDCERFEVSSAPEEVISCRALEVCSGVPLISWEVVG